MGSLGIQFTWEDVADALEYTHALASDLLPILLIILAVGIGLWVAEAIIASLRKK